MGAAPLRTATSIGPYRSNSGGDTYRVAMDGLDERFQTRRYPCSCLKSVVTYTLVLWFQGGQRITATRKPCWITIQVTPTPSTQSHLILSAKIISAMHLPSGCIYGCILYRSEVYGCTSGKRACCCYFQISCIGLDSPVLQTSKDFSLSLSHRAQISNSINPPRILSFYTSPHSPVLVQSHQTILPI